VEEKKSFIIYCDWETLFDSLNTTEEAGELIKALFAFAKRGEIAEFTGALKMAFAFMSQQIAKDAEKWEDVRRVRAECGRLGGLRTQANKSLQSDGNQKQANQAIASNANQNKQKQANESKANQNKQKQANQAVNVNVNVNDNVILKENYTKEKNAQTLEAVINDYTENAELKTAIQAFVKLRKAIKAPLTDRALQLNLNKLNKLADNDDLKIAIIEQSIERGWKGLFPLKDEAKDDKKDGYDPSKYEFLINNF
jgi:hypothetical protein